MSKINYLVSSTSRHVSKLFSPTCPCEKLTYTYVKPQAQTYRGCSESVEINFIVSSQNIGNIIINSQLNFLRKMKNLISMFNLGAFGAHSHLSRFVTKFSQKSNFTCRSDASLIRPFLRDRKSSQLDRPIESLIRVVALLAPLAINIKI